MILVMMKVMMMMMSISVKNRKEEHDWPRVRCEIILEVGGEEEEGRGQKS